MRDLTEGAPYDVPPGPFGGSEGYAFSTNGQEIAYTTKDAGRENAWSTDVNVYLVPVTGGPASVITAANKGADQNPVYSPDGRFIAYASQAEAGFESDRWRLMLYDRSAKLSRELLTGWDRNADAYFFAPDMKAVYVVAGEAARDKLFRFPLARGTVAGKPQRVIADSNNVAFSMSRDGRAIVWARDATERPAEIYGASLSSAGASQPRQLTHLSDSLVSRLQLHAAEDFWYRGAGDDSVHGFVVKPPQWESGKKFPVVLLIHGGPQGAWLDSWHSRWNYQLMAAPGFGVVVLNPRGSTGYGQQFVNEVSQDWGGKVYDDLMRGLDAALGRFTWLDSTRMGAAGGSFGGYMVNWIAGHSNRFDALVSHAGVFNLEHMYGATEELWFVEKEFNGPYWNSAAMSDQYRKYSPHLFAGNFRTPTLVLHGELDYRVPYTEGLSLFTALRRQNVPSRLVMYPDEGHWITKPQNQRLWWNELQRWLTTYLGKPAM
ncbi:MAG: S9 family peptidase [Anaerolineae bacterium]|nr:S9 family peptidase [Gemmatimonadaceae bacterium]